MPELSLQRQSSTQAFSQLWDLHVRGGFIKTKSHESVIHSVAGIGQYVNLCLHSQDPPCQEPKELLVLCGSLVF